MDKPKKKKKLKTSVDNDKRNSDPKSSDTAKKEEWELFRDHLTEENVARDRQPSMTSQLQHPPENLIEEMRKAKRMRSKLQGDVFTLLKSQATLTEKVFSRQRKSAKEVLLQKSLTAPPQSENEIIGQLESNIGASLYNYNIRSRFPITPEIQVKMEKIRKDNEKKAKKTLWTRMFEQILSMSILGQTMLANPRFYSLDPLEHLPEMCRRCKHPLADTLTSRFSPVGIVFAILIPILGLVLLYANREFVCVVCDEMYVYGDLTARPEKEDGRKGEDRHKKK